MAGKVTQEIRLRVLGSELTCQAPVIITCGVIGTAYSPSVGLHHPVCPKDAHFWQKRYEETELALRKLKVAAQRLYAQTASPVEHQSMEFCRKLLGAELDRADLLTRHEAPIHD